MTAELQERIYTEFYRKVMGYICTRINRRADAEEGVYFLHAAPLNLSGAEGSPCRATLVSFDREEQK